MAGPLARVDEPHHLLLGLLGMARDHEILDLVEGEAREGRSQKVHQGRLVCAHPAVEERRPISQTGVGQGDVELGINLPLPHLEVGGTDVEAELFEGTDQIVNLLQRVWHMVEKGDLVLFKGDEKLGGIDEEKNRG